jgi:hypothetical protein
MAAKRKPRPRAIPPNYDTWAQREAAAERAGVEYIADLDGVAPNMYWVIRRRTVGKKMGKWDISDTCKGAHKSEVEARVAVLNRGKPTASENRSWGILNKESARRAPSRKHPNLSGLTETQWVERLYTDGRASTVLRAYVASKRSFPFGVLRSLLARVDNPKVGPDGKLIMDREKFTDELLDAISRQLFLKFGARRQQRR